VSEPTPEQRFQAYALNAHIESLQAQLAAANERIAELEHENAALREQTVRQAMSVFGDGYAADPEHSPDDGPTIPGECENCGQGDVYYGHIEPSDQSFRCVKDAHRKTPDHIGDVNKMVPTPDDGQGEPHE
jgi:hypothetical protein